MTGLFHMDCGDGCTVLGMCRNAFSYILTGPHYRNRLSAERRPLPRPAAHYCQGRAGTWRLPSSFDVTATSKACLETHASDRTRFHLMSPR
nr:uncharacterized protein LOC105884778 isoform X2 [Microcebus murinus]